MLLVGYYGFVRHTGTGIPCLFRYFFHLKCPGCGITHMLLALAKGDFREAFYSNPAVFCFLPFLCWIIIKSLVNYLYVKKTVWKMWETAGMIFFLVILTVFGVVRNIF